MLSRPHAHGKLLAYGTTSGLKSAPGLHPEPSEVTQDLRRLRSVASAQKWDIEGLTEQRDALLRELTERDETLAALEARIEKQEQQQLEAAAEAAGLREQSRRSGNVLRLATDLLALLVNLMAGSDQQQSAVVFARLLATVGLIDADYYRRHGALGPEDTDPALHYLLQGEAAGLAPNLLFDPRHYRSANFSLRGSARRVAHPLPAARLAGRAVATCAIRWRMVFAALCRGRRGRDKPAAPFSQRRLTRRVFTASAIQPWVLREPDRHAGG